MQDTSRKTEGSETCGVRRKHKNSQMNLGTETVESPARPLQGIDDIEGGDGLALGVLSVGNRITDDLMSGRGPRSKRVRKRKVVNGDIRSPRRS